MHRPKINDSLGQIDRPCSHSIFLPAVKSHGSNGRDIKEGNVRSVGSLEGRIGVRCNGKRDVEDHSEWIGEGGSARILSRAPAIVRRDPGDSGSVRDPPEGRDRSR